MRALVLFSGGLDSTTLLCKLRRKGEVFALSIDYGQQHWKELRAADEIANVLRVGHEIVELGEDVFAGSESSQIYGGAALPEGHYAEESMKKTIVPNRNMILLSIAVGAAISRGCDVVGYAAHSGDHAIYPDCRPEFFESFRATSQLANAWTPISVIAPFIRMSKADIVRLGADLDVPFELTRSCYGDDDQHCGRCGTCVERAEAFELAGVPDPTSYGDPDFWRQAVAARQK